MKFDVAVKVKTGRAAAWVRLMCMLRHVVGVDRAGRWAIWGMCKFTRIYVDGKRLRR